MDGQLLGAGLGSAIGYLYASGNSLKGKDAVLAGIAGTGTGGLVGLALEHIARVRARKEMRRRLAASPAVTDAKLLESAYQTYDPLELKETKFS